jgi:hypothetical protein
LHETGTLSCNQIIRQARDQPMMVVSEVGEAGGHRLQILEWLVLAREYCNIVESMLWCGGCGWSSLGLRGSEQIFI